jgi:hypothetical protein
LIIKKHEAENTKLQQDEDGFIKPNHGNRANKKQSKTPTRSNPKAKNKAEGWDKTNKEEEGGKENKKAKESRERATNEDTDSPRKEMGQGVVQLLWMEKPEIPPPPCRRQMETRK